MHKTLDLRDWIAATLVVLVALGIAGMDRAKPLPLPAASVPEVSLETADAMMQAGALMIDVRAGIGAHIPGSLIIPLEKLAERLGEIEHAKAQPIVVYCGDGSTRGPDAVRLLSRAGFTGAVNLKPGFSGWRDSGRPVTAV